MHSRNAGEEYFDFLENRKVYNLSRSLDTMEKMITISQREYEKLKSMALIDVELLEQFVSSVKDIKSGNVLRVK